MNLLLKLAIDFIQHFEPDELIAHLKLVTIFQKSAVDPFPVKDCAVSRTKVGEAIALVT